MYLFLILGGLLNLYLYVIKGIQQMSIATFFMYLTLVLMASILIEFIAGIIIFKFEIENSVVWTLFTGFGIECDVEDLMDYVKVNLAKVIIMLITLFTFYLMFRKVV